MRKRIVGFDFLRTFCAITVIALHSFDTNSVLRSFALEYLKYPVPIFLMLSFFLFSNRSDIQREPLGVLLQKRFQRLAPQFFVWTAVYVFIRHFNGKAPTNFSIAEVSSYIFLGGSMLHLYYIPLLFYFTAILLPYIRILRVNHLRKNILILSALEFVSLALLFFYLSGVFPFSNLFFHYFALHLPCAIFGLWMACFLDLSDQSIKIRFSFIFPILAALVFCLPFLWVNQPQQALYYFNLTFVEILLFLASYHLINIENNVVSWLSKLSFGIYLCHPLFIEGLQRLESRLGFDLSSINLTLANFLISCFAAIGLSFVLFRFKKTRFLVT